jgi:hypothetical protein
VRRADPAGGGRTPTQQLVDDARAALGRFRPAWGWLADALHPSAPGPRPTRPPRHVDEATAAAQFARYRYERAHHLVGIIRGAKPSAPHNLPVMIGPVDARTRITTTLATLAARTWENHHPDPLALTIHDRPTTKACPWCEGHGHVLQPELWLGYWPEHPITCPLCQGRMVIAARTPCQACAALGPCPCDRADVLVALALQTITGILDICNAETAGDIAATIDDCAALAETIAGAGRDRRRLPGTPPPECPVCGTRELTAEVSSPDPREWSVRCEYADCVCEGLACKCGAGTDHRSGRPHTWPARLWDGPIGLAAVLGVASAQARATWQQHVDALHDQAFDLELARLYAFRDDEHDALAQQLVVDLAHRDAMPEHEARELAAAYAAATAEPDDPEDQP